MVEERASVCACVCGERETESVCVIRKERERVCVCALGRSENTV